MIGQIAGIANGIAAVVVVLGLCIFAHEFGHFVAAKLSGMHVKEFAFGLGPVLFGFQRGETRYSLRAIPFGGLNDIAGMEPGQRDVERGFYTRPRWMQVTTIAAGVFMNVVLAVVLFWGLAVFSGVPVADSQATFVSDVLPDQPAAAAGLRAGDRIVAIDGHTHSLAIDKVRPDSSADSAGLKEGYYILKVGGQDLSVPAELIEVLMAAASQTVPVAVVDPYVNSISESIRILQLPSLPQQQSHSSPAARVAEEELGISFAPIDQQTIVRYISTHPDAPLALTLQREGQQVVRTVKPEVVWDRLETITADGRIAAPHRRTGRIGVILSPRLRRTGLTEGLQYGAKQSVLAVLTVVDILHSMLQGTVAIQPTGPVGIIAATAAQAKAGWGAVVSWAGLISANLAVINLLPIPPFDGFHFILIGYEAVVRRRVRPRQETIVRLAGIMVIIMLFAWLVAKDVTNLILYGTP